MERAAEQTTLHGVKDFHYAKAAGKVFWGIVGIVVLTGLFSQLRQVVMSYASGDIGARMSEYSPTQLPVVYICPDRWVSAEKAQRLGFVEESVNIMNGYMFYRGYKELFLLVGVEGLFKDGRPIGQNAIIAKMLGYVQYFSKVRDLWKDAGSNIEDFVAAVGLDEISALHAEIHPLGEKLTQQRFVTISGVCFGFGSNLTINAVQSEHISMKIAFNVSGALASSVGKDSPSFSVYLSPVEEKNLGFVTHKDLDYGGHYLMVYTARKINRISSKRSPCGKITRSGMAYCSFAHGNKVAKGKKSFVIKEGCETPLPATNSYPANNVENPCNAFLMTVKENSVYQTMNLSYTSQEWRKICPLPCSMVTYQYTIQKVKQLYASNTTSGSYTLLEIKAAEGIMGLKVDEYFILGNAGVLSLVGGTFALWLGASVMSIFQIFYIFCSDKIIKKKKKSVVADRCGKEGRKTVGTTRLVF